MVRKAFNSPYHQKRPLFLSFAAGLAGFTIIYFLLFTVVSPQRYALEVGDIATASITATKNVDDEVTTERRRKQASDAELPYYWLDPGIEAESLAELDAINDLILGYRQRYWQNRALYGESYVPAESLKQEFLETVPFVANASEAARVLMVPDDEYNAMYELVTSIISEKMSVAIPSNDQLDTRRSDARSILSSAVGSDLQQISKAMINAHIRINQVEDAIKTEEKKQSAADAVETVSYKKGQTIVRVGEQITEAHYAMLDKLGLLQNSATFDINLYLGLGVVVGLVYANLFTYFYIFQGEMLSSPKMTLLIVTVFITAVGVGMLTRRINTYMIPVQLCVFLLAILVRPRVAIVVNTIFSVIMGVLATGEEGLLASQMFSIMLLAVLSGIVSVVFVRKSSQRISLIYAGLTVAVINFIIMFGIGLMTISSITETLIAAAFSAGSSVLSAVLAMGILPLIESIFSVVTPQKLMELSNPNHPLLRRLQTEAPGTYHHSLIVANLAEAAAQAIGADELLARVGAYYHDIGKLKRPFMFKENQIGENPHDTMEPRASASIITAHTRDGAALSHMYKLPRPIEDIVVQHHGSGMAMYFYINAQKAAEAAGETVDPADFSYDGPKPQSKEAAIVYMADSVEAASRTMKSHDRDDIDALVRRLVSPKTTSGQLDESPLTFKDIELIIRTFVSVLCGFYHERIEYPELPPRPQTQQTARHRELLALGGAAPKEGKRDES